MVSKPDDLLYEEMKKTLSYGIGLSEDFVKSKNGSVAMEQLQKEGVAEKGVIWLMGDEGEEPQNCYFPQ